ncbi:hypothetical protein CYMTET_5461 [Cymbomonas tetramitiformis]|uniref:Uncharacterized protein n=1 Tax=Cymbomonas tetramitiformis TaxID=36881 RepID=A0AAE0GZC6_9CHLO|nr:hypothetical protein CYMTET_5461 [Cymbomonas tetramitiformis]
MLLTLLVAAQALATLPCLQAYQETARRGSALEPSVSFDTGLGTTIDEAQMHFQASPSHRSTPAARLLRSDDAAGDLFFSMYIEGSGSTNKALQLFNPSCEAVSLDEYSLLKSVNGNPAVELELSGVVSAGSVYTLCASALQNVECDLLSSYVSFNGDDALALQRNDVLLDTIGVLGTREYWQVAGIYSATKDRTLVRKPEVVEGNTDWDLSAGEDSESSEWVVYAINTLDFLGCHTASSACNSAACPGPPPPPPYSPPSPQIPPSPPYSPPHPIYPPFPPGDVLVNSSDTQEAGVLLAEAVGAVYVHTIQLSSNASLNATLPEIMRELRIIGDEIADWGRPTIDAQRVAGLLLLGPGANVTLVNVALVNGVLERGPAARLASVTLLTLIRCMVAHHFAAAEGVVYVEGENAVVQIQDSLFVNNSAAGGGSAIYAALSGEEGRLELSGSRLQGNLGSAVTVTGCGSLVLTECDLSYNAEPAGNGAGVAWSGCDARGALSVVGSHFGGNWCEKYGGAVNLYAVEGCAVEVTGSLFENNSALAATCSCSSSVNCDCTGSGGAIGSGDCLGSDIHIVGSSFLNNSGAGAYGKGGALQAVALGSFRVVDCVMQANMASGHGGGIYFRDGDDVELSGTRLQGNIAGVKFRGDISDDDSAGGGIYAEGCRGVLIAQGTEILGNRAYTGAGASVVLCPQGLNISDSQLSLNLATATGGPAETFLNNYGGGVYIKSTPLTISVTLFDSNSAGDYADEGSKGGSVYSVDSVVRISHTHFVNSSLIANVEASGSALFGVGSDVTLTEVHVHDSGNCAEWYYPAVGSPEWDLCDWSAAIAVESSVLYVYGGLMDGNRRGALKMMHSAALLSGTAFSNNSVVTGAVSGAAVYFFYSNATIEGCNFTGNTVPGHGGALYMVVSNVELSTSVFHNQRALSGGAISFGTQSDITDTVAVRLSIVESEFTGNVASGNTNSHGGAVYIDERSLSVTAVIERTSFLRNAADNSGGGVWVKARNASIIQCILRSNFAGFEGGGARLLDNGATPPLLSGTTIANNTAIQEGGGLSCGSLRVDDGCLISGNVAEDGGGIRVSEVFSRLTVTGGSRIEGNVASFGGGGIIGFTSTSEVVLSNGSVVSENTAESGGGIYLYTNSSVHVDQGSEVSANTADRDGGGIYVEAYSLVVLTNGSRVHGNAATYGSGGGVCAFASAVTISQCEVTMNTCPDGDGGGLYNWETEIEIRDQSKVLENQASRFGGGLFVSKGRVLVGSGSRLDGNEAGVFGGALYIKESLGKISENAQLSYNSAGYEGGGISVVSSSLEVLDSSILQAHTHGLGGGMLVSAASNVSVTRASMLSCVADEGGAIAVQDSTIQLRHTELTGNRALGTGGALFLKDSDAVMASLTISENIAHTDGGGVHIFRSGESTAQGRVSLQDSNLTSNAAWEDGGAVWVSEFGQLVVSNSELVNNSAALGAGMVLSINVSDVAIEHTVFQSSRATYAGAIFSHSAQSRSTFRMENLSFVDNRAVSAENIAWIYSMENASDWPSCINCTATADSPLFSTQADSFTIAQGGVSIPAGTTVKATSGSPIEPSLTYTALDVYGNIINRAEVVGVSAAVGGMYGASLGGATQIVYAKDKGAEFTNLILSSTPGETVMMIFQSSVQEYEPVNLFVRMTSCQKGEVYNSDAERCERCVNGTIKFDNSSTLCSSCADTALRCHGGNQFTLQDGWWMGSEAVIQDCELNDTACVFDHLYECAPEHACSPAGTSRSNIDDANYVSQDKLCTIGYNSRVVLCASCDTSYRMDDDGRCWTCPEHHWHMWLQLVTAFMAIVVGAGALVMAFKAVRQIGLRGAIDQMEATQRHDMLLNVFLGNMQVLAQMPIIFSDDVIPTQIRGFLKAYDLINFSFLEWLPITCLQDSYMESDRVDSFYMVFVSWAVLPFFICIPMAMTTFFKRSGGASVRVCSDPFAALHESNAAEESNGGETSAHQGHDPTAADSRVARGRRRTLWDVMPNAVGARRRRRLSRRASSWGQLWFKHLETTADSDLLTDIAAIAGYLLVLMHPIVATRMLRLFQCEHIKSFGGRDFFLSHNLQVQCFTETWWHRAYLAITVILTYVVLMPGVMMAAALYAKGLIKLKVVKTGELVYARVHNLTPVPRSEKNPECNVQSIAMSLVELAEQAEESGTVYHMTQKATGKVMELVPVYDKDEPGVVVTALTEPRVKALLGPYRTHFKSEYVAWGPFDMVRKVLQTSMVVIVQLVHPEYDLLYAIMVCVAALLLHMLINPYRSELTNRFQSFYLVNQELILVVCLGERYMHNDVGSAICAAVIIALQAVISLCILGYVFTDMQTVHKELIHKCMQRIRDLRVRMFERMGCPTWAETLRSSAPESDTATLRSFLNSAWRRTTRSSSITSRARHSSGAMAARDEAGFDDGEVLSQTDKAAMHAEYGGSEIDGVRVLGVAATSDVENKSERGGVDVHVGYVRSESDSVLSHADCGESDEDSAPVHSTSVESTTHRRTFVNPITICQEGRQDP